MTRLYRWLSTSSLITALLLLPIGVFFVYFFTFQYNIPWFDDFENIPFFLNRFLTAPDFSDKVAALVRPNNEHRVVYARLITLLEYGLTGGLNFGHLMLWGNAALVIMFYLIYSALLRHERTTRRAIIGALPVPVLLFSAQMYLMTFTAVFTLQYLSIIMLVMLTLFVLTIDRPATLAGAVLLGLLSSFSMGNGLLVWPAGAAMLFIQRRWLPLGIWLVAGALSGYLYFRGYPVQQGNAEGFTYVMHHPLQTMAGFVILVGNAFDIFPTLPIHYRVYIPFAAGLFLLAGLGYWLVRMLLKRKKNTSFLDVFLFGNLLFLLATFSLFALFRIRFNFEMVVHLSYRIYALTLCALACVLLFSRMPEAVRMRVWPAVWLFSVALTGFTYFTYLPLAIERRHSMQALTFNQLHNNIGLGGSQRSILTDYIADQLSMMKARNWYHLPDPAIMPGEGDILAPVSGPLSAERVQVDQRPDFIIVSNTDPRYSVGFTKGTYVILKSDQRTYLLFANRKTPTGLKPWPVAPGFSVPIPIALIQSGRYRVGLFHTDAGRSDYRYLNQFIDVR